MFNDVQVQILSRAPSSRASNASVFTVYSAFKKRLQYFCSTISMQEMGTGTTELNAKTPTSAPKSESRRPTKTIEVVYHGHVWKVHPMKCRNATVYRVYHRVNGERIPRNFSSLQKAKADAKAILKDLYAAGETQIHLTEDEKRDWHAAMSILKTSSVRMTLETMARHYCDLVKIVGHASLLTDVARKYAEGRGKTGKPIKLAALQKNYLDALAKRERSTRYQDAQASHTGQFVKHVGDGRFSDQITRELIQEFIDSKGRCDPRTKLNLLNAVDAMMRFGKSTRCVPVEWEEAKNVILPAVKAKKIRTYTAEELKKLLAAAPEKFQPVLALAAFAGIRSSEIELLDWKHVRLDEENRSDFRIHLDVDVTDLPSKRIIEVNDTLLNWIAGPSKVKGRIWTGTHDDFYRMQQTVAKKAGITWQNNALRHTFISAQVAKTQNVPQVAYESGNSVAVIKRNYLELMPKSQAEAWFSVTRKVVGQYESKLQQGSSDDDAEQIADGDGLGK